MCSGDHNSQTYISVSAVVGLVWSWNAIWADRTVPETANSIRLCGPNVSRWAKLVARAWPNNAPPAANHSATAMITNRRIMPPSADGSGSIDAMDHFAV